MKRKKPTKQFWTVLSALNVLVLMYPVNLLMRAKSIHEHLFAIAGFIGSIFLLVVVDAVSIVVADTAGKS